MMSRAWMAPVRDREHWAAIAEAKECVSSQEALAAHLEEEEARAEIARLRNLLGDDHPEP